MRYCHVKHRFCPHHCTADAKPAPLEPQNDNTPTLYSEFRCVWLGHVELCSGRLRRRESLTFSAFYRVPNPQCANITSSAQGRGLSSATTVYLQAMPQTALPKPEHRPNCRCPVNNYRVVVGNLSLGGNGWDGHPWNTECFSLSLSTSVH